ncbi:hypothetical protein V6N13_141236 [Hibiscus sabdariffa]|uniref:Secreted protein n=1 Tax=Hibiscus sabdariffa TaxID=183260 RepID=A0ABR2Q0V1_9ROSI
MLLVTLAPAALHTFLSSSFLEHSTNAVKNGSFRKLSPPAVVEVFFRASKFPRMFFLEVGEVTGGGNGSSLMDSFFLWTWFCRFLGIPGKLSQENGTPENRSGATGLRSESS